MTNNRRPAGDTPCHLFDAWPQVVKRLRAAEHWLVLLDFDGTIAPLTANLQAARLGPNVKRVLMRLAASPRARIYIISGRPLAYLRCRIKVPGITLLGLYGWETQEMKLRVRDRARLLEAKEWLRERLSNSPGIKIEDKGLGLGVHYRGAKPPEIRAAQEATLQAQWSLLPGMRLIEGSKAWELLPSFVVGKGAATRRLLARWSPQWLPVYAGDDRSDEPAFAEIRRGVTIQVGGRGKSKARFRLRNPAEVAEFLKRLEEMA